MKLHIKHSVLYKRPPFGRKVKFNDKGMVSLVALRKAGVYDNEIDLSIMLAILGNRHLCGLLTK